MVIVQSVCIYVYICLVFHCRAGTDSHLRFPMGFAFCSCPGVHLLVGSSLQTPSSPHPNSFVVGRESEEVGRGTASERTSPCSREKQTRLSRGGSHVFSADIIFPGKHVFLKNKGENRSEEENKTGPGRGYTVRKAVGRKARSVSRREEDTRSHGARRVPRGDAGSGETQLVLMRGPGRRSQSFVKTEPAMPMSSRIRNGSTTAAERKHSTFRSVFPTGSRWPSTQVRFGASI